MTLDRTYATIVLWRRIWQRGYIKISPVVLPKKGELENYAEQVYELINQAVPKDAEIKMISNSNTAKIDMGGLDKDTEILTHDGWLKINQYENQNILTYEPQTNNATFEKPKAYIKLPCSTFFHYVKSIRCWFIKAIKQKVLKQLCYIQTN